MNYIIMGLALLTLAGCSTAPLPVVKTDGTISERVLIVSTTDGYHLTFSKPTGEVTRRLWCDDFAGTCIDGK